MNAPGTATPLARETYDAFSSAYDDFNQGYMYERWTARLLGKAEEAGLEGNRLLDVGCGTGLSFIPMLERGFEVTGCDISPAMLELARKKVGDAATLLTADMRELPELGEFDLIWSIDDAMNYLLSVEELQAALKRMERNLAAGGVIVFDVNTLTQYRNFFSERTEVEANGRRFIWQGLGSEVDLVPGAICESRFEVAGDETATHRHRQRHFSEADVLAAAAAAGLRRLAVYGELDGELSPGVDEDLHTKFVFVLGR